MLQRYFAHLWNEMSATGRRTFPFDLLRGFSQGILFSFGQLFALFVAIEYFDASETQKSLIAGAAFSGLLLSLFYASWSPLLRRNTLAAALPLGGSALGLVIAATADNAMVYTCGATLAGLCLGLPVPIFTGIYRSNYRARVRGQVFGITAIVTALMTIAAGYAGSAWLDVALQNFRPLLLGLSVSALIMAGALLAMPANNIRDQFTVNPLTCFGAIRQNPAFGYMLLAWFIFGIANLALMPQRVEMLVQEKYGFELRPEFVGLIVVVIPEVCKLLMIPFWARVFDRFNFIYLRMILNTLFITYFIFYYLLPGLWSVILGSCFIGIAFGGGAVAWQLWVTKYAPPDETSRYMAVHTFFTGVRGVIAPFLGYAGARWLGLSGTATVSIILTLLSIVLLYRIRHMGTRPDKDVSEVLRPGADNITAG